MSKDYHTPLPYLVYKKGPNGRGGGKVCNMALTEFAKIELEIENMYG